MSVATAVCLRCNRSSNLLLRESGARLLECTIFPHKLSFPAFANSYLVSRAWYQQHVFPLFLTATRFFTCVLIYLVFALYLQRLCKYCLAFKFLANQFIYVLLPSSSWNKISRPVLGSASSGKTYAVPTQ